MYIFIIFIFVYVLSVILSNFIVSHVNRFYFKDDSIFNFVCMSLIGGLAISVLCFLIIKCQSNNANMSFHVGADILNLLFYMSFFHYSLYSRY